MNLPESTFGLVCVQSLNASSTAMLSMLYAANGPVNNAFTTTLNVRASQRSSGNPCLLCFGSSSLSMLHGVGAHKPNPQACI